MDECMPHYYKITNGHGQGAETIMRAEADFMRACFADAQIMLERAYAQIDGNGQKNMALCCDFLAWRLSLCTSFTPRESFEQRREALLQQHNVAWLNILQSSCAYYYALLGLPEKIPAVFREHQLASIHFLAPGKPMMELIENQVYLAQGEYAKVIGHSEALLGMCEAMHYALVALHIRLQTAAAYEMLGKRETADELLISALAAAEPDALYLPFVENYRYLKTALTRGAGAKFAAFVRTVTPLGEDFVRRCGEKRAEGSRPAALAGLTERESAIAALVAKRLSNREIAEQLFLSEGSVKQYINQIYSKHRRRAHQAQAARRARRAEELRHSKDAARLFCIDIPKKLSNLWLIPTFSDPPYNGSTVDLLFSGGEECLCTENTSQPSHRSRTTFFGWTLSPAAACCSM